MESMGQEVADLTRPQSISGEEQTGGRTEEGEGEEEEDWPKFIIEDS